MARIGIAIRRLQFQRDLGPVQQVLDRAAHQAGFLRRCRAAARSLHGHAYLRRAAARADAGEFGQPLLHQVAEGAVGNLREQRLAAFGQPCLAVEAGQVHVDGHVREEEFRQRRGRVQMRIEAGDAFLAHQRVRVLAFGQEQEQGLAPVPHPRQHRFQRLPRRAASGAVAVEAEIHVGRVAEQQFRVFGRGRGAERGHRLRHAVLRQRDHVHVALDHDQAFEPGVRLFRLPQAVQFAALVEQRGFRRVEVFRRILGIDHASAERDDASASVVDREHQPVAELVVDVAAVLLRKQTGAFEQLHAPRIGAERVAQRGKPVRRIADAEAFDDAGVDAALVDVSLRLVVLRELAAEEGVGRVQRGENVAGVAILVALAGIARHFQPGALGQFVDRVEEFEAVVVHQERDRGAVRAAAEAVVELLGRRHGERGRAFVVERTARGIFAALLLQRNARADDLDDVRSRE